MIKQCLSVLILSAGLVSLSAYSDTTKNVPNPPINVTMDMKNIPAIDLHAQHVPIKTKSSGPLYPTLQASSALFLLALQAEIFYSAAIVG